MIPTVAQTERLIARIKDGTNQLENGLTDLFRRGRLAPTRDSYPTTPTHTTPDDDDGNGRIATHGDPTGQAATLNIDHPQRPDRLTSWAIDANQRAQRILAELDAINGLIDLARRQETNTQGRQNTVPICLACDDPAPRPRRGLCLACYQWWRRNGTPELAAVRKARGGQR